MIETLLTRFGYRVRYAVMTTIPKKGTCTARRKWNVVNDNSGRYIGWARCDSPAGHWGLCYDPIAKCGWQGANFMETVPCPRLAYHRYTDFCNVCEGEDKVPFGTQVPDTPPIPDRSVPCDECTDGLRCCDGRKCDVCYPYEHTEKGKEELKATRPWWRRMWDNKK